MPGMLAWTHDSAAALIRDSKLIATVEEERFSKIRHHRGYPYKAVEWCLKEADLKKEDIDVIAVSFDPYAFLKHFPINLHWVSLGKNILNLFIFLHYRLQAQKEFPRAKVIYIPHHLSHAASAYYLSGFDTANILTIDGSGEIETFSFFIGKGKKIKKVWDIRLDGMFGGGKRNSIGLVYSRVTNFLNLGVQGEGKTMGLASYGEPRYDFSKILDVKNHRTFFINRKNVEKFYGSLARSTNKEPITQEHKDLAASLQKALEDSIVNLAREAYTFGGIKNFCLAGGVALNCNMNSRILSENFCESIFIQPAASDCGVALGAALEAALWFEDKPVGFTMEHAYWGPEFSNEEIEGLLKEAKVSYEFHKDIEQAAATLLAQGKIIGWFQGRMELGPRALGNRSILADPTVHRMNDRVNNFVKHREPWRPLAPMVLEESGGAYFENYTQSPFMLLTFYVKREMRGRLPAITHIDGSARIQTVNERQNRRLVTLLQKFEKLRGIPMLLNTSFNDHNEPIVCTPKDALRCYFSTGLDALVLGNYLLRK